MEHRSIGNSVRDVKQESKDAARQAMRSPWIERLMRLGFFVRGLVYGWLLLAIVAAGSIAFGAYSILGAFWFRFKKV
jgi:hypothetical protein